MFAFFTIAVVLLPSLVSGGCINAGSKWPKVDTATTIKWCHVCLDPEKAKNNCWSDDEFERIRGAMTWWEQNGANVQFSEQGECTDQCGDDCVKFYRMGCIDKGGSDCTIGTLKFQNEHQCKLCMLDSDGRLRHEIAHILGFCHEHNCFGVSNRERFAPEFAAKKPEEVADHFCDENGRKEEFPAGAGCAVHGGFDVDSVMLYSKASLCPEQEKQRKKKGAAFDRDEDAFPSEGDQAVAAALYPPAQRSSSEEAVGSIIMGQYHAIKRLSAPILLSVSGISLLLFALLCYRVCKIKQTGGKYAELLYDDEI